MQLTELTILHFFEKIAIDIVDQIMYYITLLGDKGIFWIVLALIFLFALPKRYRKVGLAMGIALVFSVLFCNVILKHAFMRDRPFWADPTFIDRMNLYADIDDWSFPSGHTCASFAAAVAMRMWRKVEGSWAIVLAVLISLSRIYLCVHYPTDVLASVLLGIICGLLGYFFSKLLINKCYPFRKVFKGGQSYLEIFRGRKTAAEEE